MSFADSDSQKEKGGDEKVKKTAVVLLVFALFLMTFAVAPVLALGPTNAFEVGNNPRLEVNPEGVEVVTQSNVVVEFIPTGRINHFVNAKSSGEGIMNNVALAVKSPSDFAYLGAHASEFMNNHKWVFFSGELTEGGTWGGHGAFYWFLTRFGAPPEHALEMAMEAPYGVYLRGHYVGWS